MTRSISTKGKTYEEIYGFVKGQELRKIRSIAFKKIDHSYLIGENNPMKRRDVRLKHKKNLMIAMSHVKENGTLKGENNPMFKNWKSREFYPKEWTNELKCRIIEENRSTCQLCGKDGVCVHHIDYNKKNCSPFNLILLCRKCHAKTNTNRNAWTIFFSEMTEYDYTEFDKNEIRRKNNFDIFKTYENRIV